MEKKAHGGDIYSYSNTKFKNPIDFSANINPLGLPKGVKKILRNSIEKYSCYPDVNCSKLKKSLSHFEKIDEEMISIGNGAADLIYRLVYAIKPQKALLLAPTFSEYESALSNVDCDVDYYKLKAENSFAVQVDLLDLIQDHDILFICNPNNPTGMMINPELMLKISQKCYEENCFLIIDECFIDFVENNEKLTCKSLIKEFDQVVILKAFTKIFAMAGLRLGYLLTSNQKLLKRISEVHQPWSTSVPAQLAGVQALKATKYLSKTYLNTTRERKYLLTELNKLSITVFKGQANYLLFQLKEPFDLYNALAQKGILIRKCENYIGLDESYYRIAVKGRNDNKKLIKALQEILGGKSHG